MTDVYRILTDIEKHDAGWCTDYDVLIGPDNFECGLTEPEDRNWYRDLKEVVELLNKYHQENQELKRKIFLIEEWEHKDYKDLK